MVCWTFTKVIILIDLSISIDKKVDKFITKMNWKSLFSYEFLQEFSFTCSIYDIVYKCTGEKKEEDDIKYISFQFPMQHNKRIRPTYASTKS